MAKYVVPDGMLRAFVKARGCTDFHRGLEAALRWQAENSVKPSQKVIEEIQDYLPGCGPETIADQWVRRIWLAPEPEVPEAVKDLLWDEEIAESASPRWKINAGYVEAYRRGRAEALQEFLAEMLRRKGGEK